MKKYLFQQVHNPTDEEIQSILDEASSDGWILDKVCTAPVYGYQVLLFFSKDE